MHDETEHESTTPLAPPADSFAPVLALLSLATNPKECAARVKELRATMNAAQKAQDDLVAARTAHDACVAKEIAELAEERTRLTTLSAKLAGREGMVERREQLVAEREASPRRLPRIETFPGGMTREFTDDTDSPMISSAYDGSQPAPVSDQNNLPMLQDRRPTRRGRRRPHALISSANNPAWNRDVTLTREPG